jgi:glycosyltransferase involved in cell wall biosynthesis
MRPVVTRFHRQKSIIDKEAKEKFKEVLKRELVGFDLAITQDLYIDDCITYREAIKECGVDIPWLHWARSGVGQPINFDMPNARYVYMNYADSGIFARKIGVTTDRIRVVFNEKDPSYMWGWNPITQLVVDKMRLWEKDIIQTCPMCTTRMDAKGIDSVIRIFGILKEMGNRVALVICNSNGRRRLEEIKNKIKYAEEHGLVNGSDFLFTSTLADDEHDISREVPNKVMVELMQVSNLFVFPTVAEVCSNVLLESSMTKNLIVYNTDLPSLADFVNKEAVLAHSFTSLNSVHYSNRGKDDFIELAKKIVVKLRDNCADRQFRRVWSNHNIETLYYEQLEPILYEIGL